jgi:hypothetical protein
MSKKRIMRDEVVYAKFSPQPFWSWGKQKIEEAQSKALKEMPENKDADWFDGKAMHDKIFQEAREAKEAKEEKKKVY